LFEKFKKKKEIENFKKQLLALNDFELKVFNCKAISLSTTTLQLFSISCTFKNKKNEFKNLKIKNKVFRD
jgi:hypothetical protein